MSGTARARRISAWTLVAGLLLLPLLAPESAERAPPLHLRLLAPVAELAADLQWIRFARARRRGEEVRALALAESALALDPWNPAGWECFSAHLGLFLASREREPDPARRRAWFEAGLAVAARGAERSRDPGALHLQAAILLLTKAEADPEVSPDGARGLFARAADACARAAELGVDGARELERYARERSANERE